MENSKQSPIRILHVLTAMNMAGTETLLMNFYRNIDRSRVQFDFAVTSTEHCDYDDEITSLGGKIIHYPLYNPLKHESYKKWWNDFFTEHPEYKVVHGHIGSTAAIYLKIAKKHGCFTIAHSHSTKGNFSLINLAYQIYSYPTRYIADQFFGCSQKALVDRYGKKVANSSKARVINNGIDAEKYIFNPEIRNEMRTEFKENENQLIIGTVGRLTEAKNPFETIRICKMLKDRGLNFKFLWFGDGELKADIIQSVNENHLENTIKLMGKRSDIYNVLQAFDIFLFPSIFEGLGIACIEAQASGLPTLCSDTIPPEANISDCCVFLPLNDTAAWCDEIEKTVSYIGSSEYQRPDNFKAVENAGYEIKNEAKWLENFYIKHAN